MSCSKCNREVCSKVDVYVGDMPLGYWVGIAKILVVLRQIEKRLKSIEKMLCELKESK